MAASPGFDGARLSAWSSAAWLGACCQLSLKATLCPLLSNRWRVGLISGLLIPDCARDGPSARTTTLAGLMLLPPRTKPPIITFSAVWTKPRVLIFARRVLAAE